MAQLDGVEAPATGGLPFAASQVYRGRVDGALPWLTHRSVSERDAGRELLCYLARAGCCVGGHVVFEQDHTVGNVEVVSDPPTTTTVETSRDRCRGRTRSINGEMGSRLTSSRILSSLIMKFVALVSSSTSRSDVPTSKASAMFAACEVEPEALAVDKVSVVRPPESSPIMAEMSTPETLLPSSALTLTASPRATTSSLPSPGTWL